MSYAATVEGILLKLEDVGGLFIVSVFPVSNQVLSIKGMKTQCV